jgi:U3 small nucleolar RNA-associated protein MPP10
MPAGEDEEENETEDTVNQLKEQLELLEAQKDEQDMTTMSAYQKKIAKLKEQIGALEDQLVAEKPWTLRGEVNAKNRPKNSLLEVNLDFEQATKPAPLITEEVTSALEDVIKQRIKDKSWDDPIRRKPEQRKPKAQIELDHEKSKIGLGEVYEKEFMEKATGVSEAQEQLSEEHRDIQKLFRKICYHFDRMSNFYFTPKPVSLVVLLYTDIFEGFGSQESG